MPFRTLEANADSKTVSRPVAVRLYAPRRPVQNFRRGLARIGCRVKRAGNGANLLLEESAYDGCRIVALFSTLAGLFAQTIVPYSAQFRNFSLLLGLLHQARNLIPCSFLVYRARLLRRHVATKEHDENGSAAGWHLLNTSSLPAESAKYPPARIPNCAFPQ